MQPFESASEIVNSMQSWAVQDCVCRKQKALIGEACGHPLDVCMVFSKGMVPPPGRMARWMF